MRDLAGVVVWGIVLIIVAFVGIPVGFFGLVAWKRRKEQ